MPPLEKMAQAIAEHMFPEGVPWDDYLKEKYLGAARAALDALEPSEAMMTRGAFAIQCPIMLMSGLNDVHIGEALQQPPDPQCVDFAREVFKAMIQAAKDVE